jgi:hypothetical protein
MCGEPIKVSEHKISLDKDGFPTLFKELKPLLTGSVYDKKFAMTILNVSKCFKPKKGEKLAIDLSTITDT